MKYYLIEIQEDFPSELIVVGSEEYLDITEGSTYNLYADERFVDPAIVISRGESIEIEGEGYELANNNILDNLEYEPTIATSRFNSKESPNLVFDKFKEVFSNDERFTKIGYHKVKVTPDTNLYRLVIPSFDKEVMFDLNSTKLDGENTISVDKYRELGFSEYQIAVERVCPTFRNPTFKTENLLEIHAFKLRYDTARIFVDEVFNEFCEQNGFDDIDFFDIEEYGYC